MCLLQDITAAYKKLARMFHPDKHQVCDQIYQEHVMSHVIKILLLQDPEKRAKAEQMFSKLKHAHEVLTDPHKRAKYDCLGEKGIAEQAWEVVSRVKTPQEIREEYESIAQARAERRRQQLTNPTSSVSMTVKYYMSMNIPFIPVFIIRLTRLTCLTDTCMSPSMMNTLKVDFQNLRSLNCPSIKAFR